MARKNRIPRRSALKGMGVIGAAAVLAGTAKAAPSARSGGGRARPADFAEQIARRVAETPLVDSHEHLVEEAERLAGPTGGHVRCNDWALLMHHYLNSDLLAAGMPHEVHNRLFLPDVDPMEKWPLFEPYWPAVKNTGYGQAAAIAIRELYGVDQLSAKTIGRVQEQYLRWAKPGFYRKILTEVARIDSCQVNCLNVPFKESRLPDLLLQDLSILGMHMGPRLDLLPPPTGIEVKELADWHKVIDWWFEKYGRYAVAVKSQAAYSRDLNFEDVKAEQAAAAFKTIIAKRPAPAQEIKLVEDHLFWYCVRKAAEYDLPIKLHTGFYAGENRMPLGRLASNPASVSDLLRYAKEKVSNARFILMHICYPYYEEMIALAKGYTNAYLDMCWAWIINPAASKLFLKHYLVTAPSNKLLTFGGDYVPVEPVVGHAAIARNGIAGALTELVEEGWLTADAALELVEPIMCGNGRRIFKLDEKKRACLKAPWVSRTAG